MGKLQPSKPQFKSRGDVRRDGYRRGKQPKFESYMFSLASESQQLSQQMTRAGFTDTELAKAAQACFHDSLKKSGLFIDSEGNVQIDPKPKKRQQLPKVNLDNIKGFDNIQLI